MNFWTTNRGVITSLVGLSFLSYIIFYSLDQRLLGLFSFLLAAVITALHLKGKRSLKNSERQYFSFVMGGVTFFFLLLLSFIQDSSIVLLYALVVSLFATVSTYLGFRFIQL